MLKKTVFILLCALTVLPLSAERKSGEKIFDNAGVTLFNVDKRKNAFNEYEYFLKDTTYAGNENRGITDMILSFNDVKPSIDETGRYPVRYSSYTHIKGKGAIGDGAAFFFRSGDRVDVESRSGVWLSNTTDLGSFTIDLRFNAGSVRDGAALFSRVGVFSGSKNGIEILFKQGRVVSYLYNIFTDEKGFRHTVALTKSPQIAENKWYHFVLSYDRITGKVQQLLDEREYDAVFATDSGDSGIGIWVPSFAKGDMPLARIGKNYAGMIDEFRITFIPFEELRDSTDLASKPYREVKKIGRMPVNREGVIESPVYQFPSSGTMVNLFKWKEKLEEGSFIRFEFRISDSYFEKNDKELKWYRIDNNQRNIYLMKTDDGYLRGKYYQWRAHLIGSPEGSTTPTLSTVAMEYELDSAPNAPLFVEVIETGDEYVLLRWKKNVEYDFLGYTVYYGLKKGDYDGVLKFANSGRITNSASGQYVTVRVDNNMIEENRFRYVRGVLEYPKMKNNVLYYFAVTAYDSYKPDTQFNHESKKSKEVSGRPVAGSEITR